MLKGIAISLVLLCHVANHYNRFFTPLGGIGVAVFLILSGYGLSESYAQNGLKDYWKKRIISFFVPYAVVEIITIPLRSEFNVFDFILDLTLVKPLSPLGWYMNYLLMWYLTFWLIKKLRFSNEKPVFILIAVIYAVIFFFTSNIRFEQSVCFVAGVYLKELICKKGNKKVLIKSVILLAAAAAALLLKQSPAIRDFKYSSYALETLDLVLKTSAAWVIIEYTVNICRHKLKLMYVLGLASFELYLCHGYLLAVWDTDLPQMFIPLIFVAGTLAATAILYLIDTKLVNDKLLSIFIRV